MLVKETTPKTTKKRRRHAIEMEKKRVKRNGKETLTAFLLTLSVYIYIYIYVIQAYNLIMFVAF